MYTRIISVIALACTAKGAAAQATLEPTNEMATLTRCVSLAESGNARDAQATGKMIKSALRSRVSRNPRDAEPRVALARLLSQCLLPSAELMQQGELSSEALELLDQALAIDPNHWVARFMLASISDRSPSFLGRGKRAASEYDALLKMQGDRNDNAMFARVFAARGRQLSREGQTDSARALWSRGLRLFPDDADLKKLVGGAPTSMTPPAPRDSAATPLAAVQVVASAAPRIAAPSVKSVSRADVLLTAGGAADVFQTVQMQPGATRVNEGGDVYTRGVDASETAIIGNGGRIPSL